MHESIRKPCSIGIYIYNYNYIYIYHLSLSPSLSLSWDLCHVCFPWSIWCTPGPDCHQQWPPATLPREWPSCLRCWKSGNYQPLGPLGCWMAMDGPGTSKTILVARAPADPSGLWSRGVMSRMRHLNISKYIIMNHNISKSSKCKAICSCVLQWGSQFDEVLAHSSVSWDRC